MKRTYTIERPAGFYLRFEYDRKCVRGHRSRFKLARVESPLYFSVDELAASAALRHYGSGYNDPLLAVAKEDVLWAGWIGVQTNGRLIVARHVTGHSGRLREFSGSLGEAIMLAMLERLYGQPLALWLRIPETAKVEAMDFHVSTPLGGIAVEAKARKDWKLSSARKVIAKQMSRQKAAEKYGFVLLYQQRGTKRRRSSILYVIDPPGDLVTHHDPLRAMQEHFYQLSWAIGIWPVAYFLGLRLGLKTPDVSATQLEVYQRIRTDPRRLRLLHTSITVRGRRYVGRFFDAAQLSEKDRKAANVDEISTLPYFFYGLDEQLIAWLLPGTPTELDAAQSYLTTACSTFSLAREGSLGLLRYVVLSDGVLRIDLANRAQLTDEKLDVE